MIFANIITTIYKLRSYYVLFVKRDLDSAENIIKASSLLYTNNGKHKYWKLKVVPILLPLKRVTGGDTFRNSISLWLYDIEQEPLRDNSWQELLWYCVVGKKSKYGMHLIRIYEQNINNNIDLYTKKEHEALIKGIEKNKKYLVSIQKKRPIFIDYKPVSVTMIANIMHALRFKCRKHT